MWLLGLLVRNSFSKEVGLGGAGHPSEWSSEGRSGEGEGPGGSDSIQLINMGHRSSCKKSVHLRVRQPVSQGRADVTGHGGTEAAVCQGRIRGAREKP